MDRREALKLSLGSIIGFYLDSKLPFKVEKLKENEEFAFSLLALDQGKEIEIAAPLMGKVITSRNFPFDFKNLPKKIGNGWVSYQRTGLSFNFKLREVQINKTLIATALRLRYQNQILVNRSKFHENEIYLQNGDILKVNYILSPDLDFGIDNFSEYMQKVKQVGLLNKIKN